MAFGASKVLKTPSSTPIDLVSGPKIKTTPQACLDPMIAHILEWKIRSLRGVDVVLSNKLPETMKNKTCL